MKLISKCLLMILSILTSTCFASTYTYDLAGRLITATNDSGQTAINQYDSVGNLLSISHVGDFNPKINSFAPAFGEPGVEVTIFGTGFIASTSSNTVSFNGTSALVETASATKLVVQVPIGATTGTISISNTNGTVTSQNSFTVTAYGLPPVISSVGSYTANFGGTLTISGENLDPIDGQTFVFFNNSICFIESISDTSITIDMPYSVGTSTIQVSTAFGVATSSASITELPITISSSTVEVNDPLTPGATPISVSIATTYDYNAFTFSANINDYISLQFSGLPYFALVTIYDSQGDAIYTGSVSSSAESINLPKMQKTDTYFGLVENYSSGSYTVGVEEDTTLSLATSYSYTPQAYQTKRQILEIAANAYQALFVSFPSGGGSNTIEIVNNTSGGSPQNISCNSDGGSNMICPFDILPNSQPQEYFILTTEAASSQTCAVEYINDSVINLTGSNSTGSVSLSEGQNAWFTLPNIASTAYTLYFSSLSFSFSGTTSANLNPRDQNYYQEDLGSYEYYSIVNSSSYSGNSAPTYSLPPATSTSFPFDTLGGLPSYLQLSPANGSGMTANYNYVVQTVPTLSNNNASLSATVPGQPLYFYWSVSAGEGKITLEGLTSSDDGSYLYDSGTLEIIDNTDTLVEQITCDNSATVYYGGSSADNTCTFEIPSIASGTYLVVFKPSNITQWSFDAIGTSGDAVSLTATSTNYSVLEDGQDLVLSTSFDNNQTILLSSASVSSGDTLAVKIIDNNGNNVTSSILPVSTISNGDGIIINLDLVGLGVTYKVIVSSELNLPFFINAQTVTPATYTLTVNGSSTSVTNNTPGQDIILQYTGTASEGISFNMNSLVYGNSQSSPVTVLEQYFDNSTFYTMGYCSSSSSTFSGSMGTLGSDGAEYIVLQTAAYSYPHVSENTALTTGNVQVTNP